MIHGVMVLKRPLSQKARLNSLFFFVPQSEIAYYN